MEFSQYRIHPKAALVMVVLMLVASATAIFGDDLGLSPLLKASMLIPGICSVALLAFSQAKIWQKK